MTAQMTALRVIPSQRAVHAPRLWPREVVMTTDSALDSRAATGDLRDMGPIDYVVIEFPGSRFTGKAMPELLSLVDRGLIRVLDFALAKKETDGTIRGLAISDLDADARPDIAIFEGASSGLLGRPDLEEASQALEPGSAAAVLVYENIWAAPLAKAIRESGGQLAASGRIPVQAIVAALDEIEGAEIEGAQIEGAQTA